nr:MAG TPA: hypothetical protein [Caudoviricetes sp.]
MRLGNNLLAATDNLNQLISISANHNKVLLIDFSLNVKIFSKKEYIYPSYHFYTIQVK